MNISESSGRAGLSRRFALSAAFLLAALLLAPGAARAQTPSDPRNQCGALSSSGEATCSDRAYTTTGIRYDATDDWVNGVAGDVGLTVTGGSATTITSASPPNAWTDGAIVLRTAEQGSGDSTTRNISLTVGAGANSVTIAEHATATNDGVTIHQRGGAADATTVTLGSGVNIGTSAAPMKHYGVSVLVEISTNTADHSISSAATIHSTDFGILMDARGSGDVSIENAGSITTAATGGDANQKSGIRLLDWSGGRGDDRTADTTTTITNKGSITTSAANARGIEADADGLGLYKIVNESGLIKTAGATGDGIRVDARHHAGAADGRAVSVESAGDITTTGANAHGIRVLGGRGRGSISVETSGDITTTGANAHGIRVGHDSTEGGGVIRVVTTDGEITTGGNGIDLAAGAMSMSGAEIVTAAGIDAAGHGINIWNGGAGDFRVENSGEVESDAIGIHSVDAGAGDVTIVNKGGVTGELNGVFARKEGAGAGGVLVRQEAGEIHGRTQAAISAQIGRWRMEDSAGAPAPESEATARVEIAGGSVKAPETHARPAVEVLNNEGGSAEASVSEGAAVTAMNNAGVWLYLSDQRNAAGRIKVAQGGAINALQGVYATVPHGRAAGADEPLIDIAWTGSFTWAGRSWPDGRTGGVNSNSVAHAIEFAQEFQAQEVMRTASGLAGIDAEVLSWRILSRTATAGDDPGPIADAAAQTGMLDTASTDAAVKARAEAIVARFRAVLTNRRLGAIPGRAAIDADGDGAYSDAEIIAYLGEDSDARRTILRDVLKRHLSEREAEVLRALATGGDVEAALEGVPGASDAWKDEVRALTTRFNAGDIRIAVNGGSIDAGGGDGVRAFYGTEHDRNGGIAVSIARGATVKGALAGVYVAGAGAGLRIEKRYAPRAVQEANADLTPDDMVAVADHLNQIVRVQGVVTGGSDAAVHLGGGGALIVTEGGRLVAGASGVAVLVNDPGPAIIYIEGEVKGELGPTASPAPAAVHLTGGGTVTVGPSGRVDANGAALAIKGDAPTTVILQASGGRLTLEAARDAVSRVKGGIGGEGVSEVGLIVAETRDGFTTGHIRSVPLDAEGAPMIDDIPPARFDCGLAEDRRCELYEALPSFLLAMSRLPTPAERMAAPRGASGVWGRVEGSKGEWAADEAVSSGSLGYDYSVVGGRAGFDFEGPGGRFGLSAHLLRGKAEMDGVGEASLSGIGAGASVTWVWGGFHLDVSGQTTWFDAEFDSSVSGALEKDASGSGMAVGVEVSRRASLLGGALAMTQRAGLVWSNADLGDFTDSVGSAARISVERARSLKARAGFSLEKGGAEGKVFLSADVEREFSDETSVGVDDVELETKVKPTTARVGAGGAVALGESAALTISGYYEASGSDASQYGGSASLRVSF